VRHGAAQRAALAGERGARLCARARSLVRRPPLQPTRGWTWWDWQPLRRDDIVDVFLRADHRVLVLTRAAPAAGSG
jgi:hypothetical protein